ncbi:MAG: hypothetical protein U5N58_04265 [Actinomycetota bacterium]|nr:hypothetical protein [Actinomycetota bacterium]
MSMFFIKVNNNARNKKNKKIFTADIDTINWFWYIYYCLRKRRQHLGVAEIDLRKEVEK